MYSIPGAALSEHQTIVQMALHVYGVVCLLSARRFLDLHYAVTFRSLDSNRWQSRLQKEDMIPLRSVPFSGKR